MKHNNILDLLRIDPSPQSLDFVQKKRQFQLHSLITEQRHPKTWDLSFVIKHDIAEGLSQIFSVDEDISQRLGGLSKDTSSLDQAVRAISQAMRGGKKIYIYGCGSTGRLAKQMESALWRPFWQKLKTKKGLWNKLKASLPEDIEDRLTGEMTGGDRALISALEGFEDLELVGKLQLQERGMKKGDVVFCITEGGETSSVIGTIRAASEQYGTFTKDKIRDARNHLYFIYNNPDDVLLPFDRSRSVLENPAITKINLTTGPQSITGSTRMQATTVETFIMGIILEFGIRGVLEEFLSDKELTKLGFTQKKGWKERFLDFENIKNLLTASLEKISQLTALESETYQNENYATYFARKALVTVFIDCAERSPTFHLHPLDTVQNKQRNCWIQVWTEGENLQEAWRNFLWRDFHGLDEGFYRPYFLDGIDDAYLKDAALRSLSQAGNDQKNQYDFSFGEQNIKTRRPQKGDLGVCVCLEEEIDELLMRDSQSHRFIRLFKENNAYLALILIDNRDPDEIEKVTTALNLDTEKDIVIHFYLPASDDPLGINRQTLLKMLLNGHSTAVMARLARIVGNTMTHVNPSNLKLIGRATYLIRSHVNDTISTQEWRQRHGKTEAITYAEANAVLFEAMGFIAGRDEQISEVELSVIRILEALKKRRFIRWEEAIHVQNEIGLERYLEQNNPKLRYHKMKKKSPSKHSNRKNISN
jgi:N-acetylmuramic acid 6-phosphate etherase